MAATHKITSVSSYEGQYKNNEQKLEDDVFIHPTARTGSEMDGDHSPHSNLIITGRSLTPQQLHPGLDQPNSQA